MAKTRRKRQPTADVMREQLRMAADEIIRLRGMLLAYGWNESDSVCGWAVFHEEDIGSHKPRRWWQWWRS